MKWSVIKGHGTPPYKPGDKLDLNVTLYQSAAWDGADPKTEHKGTHTTTVVDSTELFLTCTLNDTTIAFYPAARLWTQVTKHILPW